MNAVKEMAYAKINLYLDVTGKREDGFHEIKTVMHTVSLADEITVSAEPVKNNTQIKLSVIGADFLPTDGRNLTVKAAELFLDRCGVRAAVNIKLKKNIPVAAGLAGGSADAAAVLRAMNKIFGKPFTERALILMAAELGSDVPYCLIGATVLCTGRGEVMSRLSPLCGKNFLIVKIPEYVSTPTAYSALDCAFGDFKEPHQPSGSLEELISGIEKGELLTDEMYNIFEVPIFEAIPTVLKAKTRLSELGAVGALMSGSGPTVFGVFESEEAAKEAKTVLESEGYTAFFAISV